MHISSNVKRRIENFLKSLGNLFFVYQCECCVFLFFCTNDSNIHSKLWRSVCDTSKVSETHKKMGHKLCCSIKRKVTKFKMICKTWEPIYIVHPLTKWKQKRLFFNWEFLLIFSIRQRSQKPFESIYMFHDLNWTKKKKNKKPIRQNYTNGNVK